MVASTSGRQTEALYLSDSYQRTFEARVVSSTPRAVVLDRTAFYPTGGGQPSDQGTLRGPDDRVWHVESVEKTSFGIVHHLQESDAPPAGIDLHGEVRWDLRYPHMRYHTALHLLSGVVFRRFGSGITGGQIYANRARMDFSLPEFSRELAGELLDQLNRTAAEGLPVSVRFLPRAAIVADPTLVRVARELLPDVDPVRLIEIGQFDVEADGGTHVRSTREVGTARLERLENKGARNKRLYMVLDEPAFRPNGAE